MDYAYNFLLKVSISILLLIATFNIWKSSVSGMIYWFMPIVALFWISITIIEGTKIIRGRKWFVEKKEQDERTLNYSYKAGHLIFWLNIIILSLLFYIYSIVGMNIINTETVLVSLFLLNITSYYGVRLYFIFYK